MHKGQEAANVKMHYEFGNDPTKIIGWLQGKVTHICITM
jgi:hypothetical protein